MFEALNKLMETIPGVRTLVLLLATFSGAVRAFQFAKFISGIGRMGKALSGLIKGFRGVEVATKRGAAGMLTAVGVGERLRGMYQDLAIAAHTYVSRVGLLRAGAVAGGYALIAGALFQVFQEQKRAEAKAKELHEELTKDLDLSTYDDVVEGINRTADAYNSAIDEMLRRGYDSVWMRFRDGFLDLIPGINTGYHDLMAIQGNEGQELEKLQARQRAMNKIYQVTALRLGVTTEEAKLLAEELGIDLEPAIRAVTNGADNAASEIDTVARKTEVAAERAREFTPAMEDMASALESMAEATTATERLRAFSDIIDASISPIIEAEKAQARLDSILGDTTDSLGDYRRETDRVSAEWAERQAEAAKDLQRAQQSLTEANANLAEARKTGTFFEVQSALEAQARAQEQVNAATERQAEVEADAQKALSGVAKTGKKAYETPQEAAWDLVDAVGGVLTQTYATTQSVDAVRERFQDMRGDLVEQLRQFGLTEQQVEHYIDILDQIPDNVEVATQLNGADQESIRTAVQESSDALNRFLQNNPEMRPTILATLGIDEADLQRLLSGKQATVDMPKAEAVRTQNEPVLSALPPSVAMTLADLEGRVAAAQEAFDNIKSDPDNIKSMLPDTYAQMLGEAAKAKTEAEDALVAFLRRWGLRSTYVQAGDIRNRAPMVSDSPILWAEGRAPEAYIPYDPRYRHRATSLLSQVAKDFGLALLPYQHPRRRSFAAGGLIPHMAIRDTATQIRRAADGVITRGATTPSSSTSISHDYGGIYVTTIDKPTGEQLGRDLAWGLMGSQRGTTRRTRT